MCHLCAQPRGAWCSDLVKHKGLYVGLSENARNTVTEAGSLSLNKLSDMRIIGFEVSTGQTFGAR